MFTTFDTVFAGLQRLNDMYSMNLTSTTADTWYLLLQDLPDQAVKAGFIWLMGSLTGEAYRKPTAADIRNYVRDLVQGSWEEIWAEVLDQSNACFSPGSKVEYTYELTAQIVQRLGGIRAIAHCEVDKLSIMRAQFRDSWKAAISQAEKEMIARGEPGIYVPQKTQAAKFKDILEGAKSGALQTIVLDGEFCRITGTDGADVLLLTASGETRCPAIILANRAKYVPVNRFVAIQAQTFDALVAGE